jgi:hypothetical protein
MKCAHKSFTMKPSLGCASHNDLQPTACISAPPESYNNVFFELKPPHTDLDKEVLSFLLMFISNFCLPFIDILCLLIHVYEIISKVCSRIKQLVLKNCVFKPHQWSGCGVLLRNKICFIPCTA